MELAIDQEFRSLIPPLTSEEFAQLEANILADGCREPITTWAGVIVDGHNRYQICTKHNIPFAVTEKEFETRTDAYIWIIKNQMGRRNLNESQRAMIASRLANMKRGDNRFTIDTPIGISISQPQAAEMLNVSTHSVQRAKQVIEHGTPELIQAVERGEIPVSRAVKEIRVTEIREQRKALADSVQEIQPDDRWNIYQANINSWQTPRQYDFIITDPPYPKEYLNLYEVLSIRAKEWLKPGGLLIAMCGQSYLNQIYEMMDRHLIYYWTACYLTPGQATSLRMKQVNSNWKPLLIYGLDVNYKGKIFGDVFKSDGNDKDFHKWGQSVSGMTSIISQICLPGQTILDPFCGAGTTGLAALAHGCLFDGIDIEIENVNISKARLNDATKA